MVFNIIEDGLDELVFKVFFNLIVGVFIVNILVGSEVFQLLVYFVLGEIVYQQELVVGVSELFVDIEVLLVGVYWLILQ